MSTQYENMAAELAELVREKEVSRAKEILSNTTPADITAMLVACEDQTMAVLFRLLSKDVALTVFELLDPPVQATLLESFTSQESLEMIKELESDELVRLFDELPAKVVKRLLDALPKETRSEATKLMGYADGTVGRMTSPAAVTVKRKTIAKDALEAVRKASEKDDESINAIYVVDDQRIFLGAVPLSAVVSAKPDTPMDKLIVKQDIVTLLTDQDQEKAARLMKRMDALELPVLDSERRLVGVLTATEALDILQEEITDDIYDKVGLIDLTNRESDRSFNLIHGSFWHVLKVRVPFLLITLAGGMLAGVVIDAFEEILEALVATAIFIPVIMDMGGNVGTQSSTIFTRGVVLGHINMGAFFKQWLRETSHGVGLGVILGLGGGLIAHFWQGVPGLGMAVGLSLAIVITLGVALGFIIPYILLKMGFDQAAGADPIITTIKDMSGLVLYFFLVRLLMPEALEAAAEVVEVAMM